MLFRLQAASPRDMEQQMSARFARPYTIENELLALQYAHTILETILNQHLSNTGGTRDDGLAAESGIATVRRAIANIFRDGQATVITRHVNRVKLILQLEFSSRCCRQFHFPPQSVPEWVGVLFVQSSPCSSARL